MLKFTPDYTDSFQLLIDEIMPNESGVNDSAVTRYQKIIQLQMKALTEEKEDLLPYVTDLRQALKLEYVEPTIRQFKV